MYFAKDMVAMVIFDQAYFELCKIFIYLGISIYFQKIMLAIAVLL